MRKKLFAIVMSMTMVASFMPSLAFAGAAHTYAVGTGGAVDWAGDNGVEAALKNEAKAKYIEVVKKPTHTEAGKVKLTCTQDFCGEVITVDIDALDHDPAEKLIDRDLTVDQIAEKMLAQKGIIYGVKDPSFATKKDAKVWADTMKDANFCYLKNVKVCSCGDIVDFNVNPTTGIEWVMHDPSSICKDKTCPECGETIKATKAHTLVPDTPTVEVKADCGHPAGVQATCSVCGEKGVIYGSGEADTAAHNYGTPVTSKEATKGLKTNQSEIKSGYVAIEVENPSVVKIAGDEIATPGLNEYTFYKCNKVTPATCTSTGTAKLVCTVCGDEKASEPLAKVDHDYVKTHVAATCDHAGYNKLECKNCFATGTEPLAATEPKLAHSYKVTKTDASCVSGEVYTIECTTCEENCENKKAVVDINTTTHVVEEPYAETTTTKTVLWTGLEGELKGKDQIELTFTKNPSSAHKYDKKEILKAATCEDDEVWGYKCTVCGKIATHTSTTYAPEVKKNTALGHDHPVVTVAATCVNKAYETKVAKCTRCGKEDAGIAAANAEAAEKAAIKDGKHAFDKWVVTKEATIFAKGVESLECSVCGADGESKAPIAKLKYAAPAVKAGKKSATVTVKATADAVKYQISYKKAGGSYKTISAKVGKKTIKKLAKGKKYTFKVIAINAEGVKVASATKTVKVK